MRMKATILAIFMMAMSAYCDTKNSIIVMTPHIWNCDSSQDQTILIDMVDLTGVPGIDQLSFRITLTNEENPLTKHRLTKNVAPKRNWPLQSIRFKLPSNVLPGSYNLEVLAKNDARNYEFRNNMTQIQCSRSGAGLYILTDKPVYRDSEIVNLRVLYIDSDLMPNDGTAASIFITDPKGNRIQQFLGVSFKNGIISGLKFQLVDRPVYGVWNVKVEVDDLIREVTFVVKEYVLPRFDIVVNVPPYVLRSAKSFETIVEAKYTFNKPVEGMVNASVLYLDSADKEAPIALNSLDLDNGKANVVVDLNLPTYSYDNKLKVTVIEKETGESITKIVPLKIVPVEFYVREYSNSIKSGENSISITIFEQNEKPYMNRSVSMNITQYLDYSKRNNTNDTGVYDTTQIDASTDLEGKVNFDIEIGENVSYIQIDISPSSDPDQKSLIYISKLTFKSDTTTTQPKLNITLLNQLDKELTLNSLLWLSVDRPNASRSDCYVARFFVLAKLKVIKSNKFSLCDKGYFNIPYNGSLLPESTVIVYYIDKESNIQIANLNLQFPRLYQNSLEISFDGVSQVLPGDLVNITLKSTPQSVAAIAIIDQSVELMGNLNELTSSQIKAQLDEVALTPYYPPIPRPSPRPGQEVMIKRIWPGKIWKLTPALQMLHDKGIAVASDFTSLEAKLVQSPISPRVNLLERGDAVFSDSAVGLDGALAKNSQAKETQTPSSDLRSDFREVWIWDTFEMGEFEEKVIQQKIPETITSWVASGFSLSPRLGLGLADKSRITTFKPFFVSTILPPSVIRSEVLNLPVIVFNYLNVSLPEIFVSLEKSSDYLVLQGTRFVTMQANAVKKIKMAANETTQTVVFSIMPTKIGQLKVTVRAQSKLAADGEMKFIKVKSQGIEQSLSRSALLTLNSQNDQFDGTLRNTVPQNIVKDSTYCVVQVIGDMLGPSLNNLGNLIQKPYGCGEQNMVGLTPNIFALDYITVSKNSNPTLKNLETLENNAKKNILDGYQRQLGYQRKDGSFSAFGDNDASGSTWLTAFVTKSFVQAKKYVNEIDDAVINKAVAFILKLQAKNGSFVENGTVIHADMQGSARSDVSITAYVTLVLLEMQSQDQKVLDAISSAVAYIENADLKATDRFSLGLLTYALLRVESPKADDYFEMFNDISKTTSDYLYWTKQASQESDDDVELTSYGLMIYLAKDMLTESVPIVKYLVSKMSRSGGFSSTQSTILALEALTKYSLRLMQQNDVQPGWNIKIDVRLERERSVRKSFQLTNENALLLQSYTLPDCSKGVVVSASGTGTALVQVITTYNVMELKKKPSFSIEQRGNLTSDTTIRVRTCLTYQGPKPTGMSLVEATLLSGYEINKLKLDELTGQIEGLNLIELKDKDTVVFYFDGFKPEQALCFYWTMYKAHNVSDLKPVPVKVYDYYDDTLQASAVFTLPDRQSVAQQNNGVVTLSSHRDWFYDDGF